MKIALSLFLVAACLCLTESRSHGNAKINTLIKRLEEARDSRRFEARVQVAGSDDCDVDGGDGILYYCGATDSCCVQPADNGNDGDWVCCDGTHATCAEKEWACENYDGSCDKYADDGNGILNWCPNTKSDQKCCFHPTAGKDAERICCDTYATCATDEYACNH